MGLGRGMGREGEMSWPTVTGNSKTVDADLPTQVRLDGDNVSPGGQVHRSGVPLTHVYSQPPFSTEQSTGPASVSASHTQRQ